MSVSVCIATFNGEEYILDQINSILPQLEIDDEIIISDDCSTDNTIDIIKSINDSRIKIFYNKGKKGVASNFENAINISSGDYIFLADQDDVWMPNKVSVQKSDLVDLNFDLSISNCEIFDSMTGKIIHSSFFNFNKSRSSILLNIYNNSFMGCCIAFKSNLKSMILPFPKQIPMHDWWIGLNALIRYDVIFNDTVLVKYRMHNNYSSTAKGKSNFTFINKFFFRLTILYYLIVRVLKTRLK